jgi:hypothetical protein
MEFILKSRASLLEFFYSGRHQCFCDEAILSLAIFDACANAVAMTLLKILRRRSFQFLLDFSAVREQNAAEFASLKSNSHRGGRKRTP